ncbi:hypothetical protein TWF569_003290 [Orbilia oligospora]|uniref:Uncharacterized protein n=1 Tax=Orbilia oligospora TaxID=2813651 RepID=A0A7C8NH46_ORBOL|nr:hypothetical protein TWF102_000925 [Orbilia oligospora]KAF3117397.1 hypothetical protein TWF103_006144 [Orbilia oligospora]KAF3152258.1 hypothetical protein TWF569_003290 [Orbilia oligospora]
MHSTTSKLRETLARAPRNSAYARHIQKCLQYVDFYGGSVPTAPKGKTERDLLEEEFEFLRDDSNDNGTGTNDTAKEIAKKYYENLFREFALIDLSRWREGQVALRWRTKQEVLQGLGQFTCASLTCPRHAAAPTEESIDEFRLDDTRDNNKSETGEGVGLETFEMNFGYMEKGVKKNALVKVCVCEKCAGKLRRVKEGRKDDDRRERRRSRDRRDSRDRRQRRHRDESEEHASRTRRRKDDEKERISDHGGVEDSGESSRRHKSRDRHHGSDRRSRRDESERYHRSNHKRTSRSRSPSHGPT